MLQQQFGIWIKDNLPNQRIGAKNDASQHLIIRQNWQVDSRCSLPKKYDEQYAKECLQNPFSRDWTDTKNNLIGVIEFLDLLVDIAIKAKYFMATEEKYEDGESRWLPRELVKALWPGEWPFAVNEKHDSFVIHLSDAVFQYENQRDHTGQQIGHICAKLERNYHGGDLECPECQIVLFVGNKEYKNSSAIIRR